MSLELQLETSLQLLLAILLSMVIGLERNRQQQPAGLRTHMLVGVGACLFTILSLHAFPGADSARVAAQIVSGIGFLGAGVILRLRGDGASDIKHLTTAASIWATAALGMTVGAGAWFLAINGTLMIWVILAVVRRFEPDKKAPGA
jgi:putative Mg2+ transporter-C (MgtC) family protein